MRMVVSMLLLVMLLVPLVYGEQDGATDQLPAKIGKHRENALVKLAWEMPSYSERYPYLRKVPWLEPNGVAEMFGYYQYKREVNAQETDTVLTYISFRPLVLDFKSWSLALGLSYIGRFSQVDDEDKHDVLQRDGVRIFTDADDVEVDSGQHAINFSVLGSFPEQGFQFIFDCGYGWSMITEKLNPLTYRINTHQTVQVPNPANPAGPPLVFRFPVTIRAMYDDYEYRQHDEGFFLALHLLKSFDRDYLNHVHLFFYSGLRSTSTELRSSSAELTSVVHAEAPAALGGPTTVRTYSNRQDLPFTDTGGVEFFDPAQPSHFNLSFVGLNANLRLFQVAFLKNRGLALDVFTGAQHISGQLLTEDYHGARLKVGGILSILEGITIRYDYLWEINNDQDDGWEISIGVAISGVVREIVSGGANL